MAAEWIHDLAFVVLALLCLAGAAGVVFQTNLVHSALCLALSFSGVAGLYGLLQAGYLAAVQLLIYNGAVAVIIVIGVMLTQRESVDDGSGSPSKRLRAAAACVSGALLAVCGWAVLATDWRTAIAPDASVPALAGLLFRDYAIALEAAAALLLAALVGAVMLAKGDEEG